MKRTRVVAGRTVLVTAAVAVGLAGCSVLSPSTIDKPYAASDGINLELPGVPVGLHDLLVVGTAKGAPASVVGTIVNDGPDPVQVGLQPTLSAAAEAAQTDQTAASAETVINVGAHSAVQIGPGQQTSMVIASLTVVPGATVGITARTLAGGRAAAQVPVLGPTGFYASLTPSPTPSATPTSTGSATADPSATDSPSPSASSTDSASKKKKKAKATSTATPSPTSS